MRTVARTRLGRAPGGLWREPRAVGQQHFGVYSHPSPPHTLGPAWGPIRSGRVSFIRPPALAGPPAARPGRAERTRTRVVGGDTRGGQSGWKGLGFGLHRRAVTLGPSGVLFTSEAGGASSVTSHSPEWSLPPARAALPLWPPDALWLTSLLGLPPLVLSNLLASEPPVVPPRNETCQHLALAMRQLAAGDREAKGQSMKQWRSDWSSADLAGSAALPSHRAGSHSAVPAGVLSPGHQGKNPWSEHCDSDLPDLQEKKHLWS